MVRYIQYYFFFWNCSNVQCSEMNTLCFESCLCSRLHVKVPILLGVTEGDKSLDPGSRLCSRVHVKIHIMLGQVKWLNL